MRISEKLRSPIGTLTGAAIVSAFDAALHIVIDMVEPPRIAGNLAGIAAFVVVSLGLRTRPRTAAVVTGLAAGVVAGLNLAWIVVGSTIPVPAALLILGALSLLLASVWLYLGEAAGPHAGSGRSKLWLGGIGVAALLATLGTFLFGFLSSAARQLHDDQLVDADIWADELEILSAGMGFDNIIGVPDSEFETVRDAGGSFYANPDCSNGEGPLVTTVESRGLSFVSRGFTDFDDGLPVVMSWPVLTSTVHPEDFLLTLNDGSQVMPNAITMIPNWELNERNTMVLFGDFGNRGMGDEPDKLFPVRMEFVDDGTPLTFVGPNGRTESGVGLTWETDTSPYESGPFLVGAKLNHIGDEATGEGGVALLEARSFPNDEFALYGGGDFRIRILTTGGLSPDGLTGVTPDQFADFFRIHATGPAGETVLMTETGVDYDLAGGTLRVVGLSDLGRLADENVSYDDCYAEDSDNYIDIILEGDEAAARGLTTLEIPSAQEDGYLSFFNPGGPGPEPFEDVRYTAPGPRDLEPIINALDDPMRVSWPE